MSEAYVSTEKRAALELRMAQLGVREADLVEKFILGSGSGGQKINKTSSCVFLKHSPTGIAIKCQQSRARDLNRFLARRELCERIAARVEGARSQRQQDAEKIRRQKRRRSRRQKERMLQDKKHQSTKKQLRGGVSMGIVLALLLAGGATAAEEEGNVQRPTSNVQLAEGGIETAGRPETIPNLEVKRSTLHVSAAAPASAPAAPPMSIIQAIVLGMVEGVTEYLPVSSTGHLLLAQRLMGMGSGEGGAASQAANAYTICIQAGAILAVLGIYFGRVRGIVLGFLGQNAQGLRLGVNLLVAFLPAAVVGLLLQGTIKECLFGDGRWGMWPIVGAWFVGGFVILVMGRRLGEARAGVGACPPRGMSLEQLPWRAALMIGLVQCLAMWPGVSRSLATILGGLAMGLGMIAAVEFSFLLGLITLSATTLVDALMHGDVIIAHYGVVTPVVGMGVATISAAAAVKWLVGYLQRHGLALFGWYRMALACVVGAWLLV